MSTKRTILLIAVCILISAGSAHAAPARITADLAEQLSRLGTPPTLPVIVVLNEQARQAGGFNLVLGQIEILMTLADVRPKHMYAHIPALALDLTPAQIFHLALLDRVARIEYDKPVYAFMDTAAQYAGTRLAQSEFGLSGAGITVAVIDTGIDAHHSAFRDAQGQSRVIAFKDFVNTRSEAYDDFGHGTHCAGIIAGGGLNGVNRGVAPAANLVGVKVMSRWGLGNTSTVIAGIDWCISNREAYSIDIISLSLGSSGSSDGQDISSQAVNRAVAAGIVAVVAAGNSGPAARTIGAPAAAETAITIGAMADPGDGGFNLASFSSRGPTADDRIKPDICAPGVNIMAPQANTDSDYVAMSGTSMAAPFVAGTAALMLEADPNLSPARVKEFLCATGVDWGSSGFDAEYGWGRLDGYHAIAAAAGSSGGSGPGVPVHNTVTGVLKAASWWIFPVPKSHLIPLDVTDLGQPISLTLIMHAWAGSTLYNNVNFNCFLRDPSGSLLASAKGNSRQETISATPAVTGRYTVEVKALRGESLYTLDASGGVLRP